MNRIIYLLLALNFAFTSFALQNEAMQRAILCNDVVKVIELGNESTENEILALDAMATQFDISQYRYDELVDLLSKAKRPRLKEYIAPVVIEHEKQILKHVLSLTPEYLPEYKKSHTQLCDIVNCYLSDIIIGSLDSMSYRELLYLDRTEFDYGQEERKSNLANRSNERKDIFRENTKEYINNEQTTIDGLKYLLEKATWEYFIQAHGQLTNAYAQIAMVNDDSFMAAEQYQRIVKACFSSQLITKILQKVINDYCSQVNKCRMEYAKETGKDTYKELVYKVPQIQFHPNVDYHCLDKIATCRKDYADNLDTSSTVSGVVTWLFSPLAGLIAKGIGDYMTIDILVDGEYNARKEYVDKLHDALCNDFKNYIVKLIADFDRSYNNNILEYERDITQ